MQLGVDNIEYGLMNSRDVCRSNRVVGTLCVLIGTLPLIKMLTFEHL